MVRFDALMALSESDPAKYDAEIKKLNPIEFRAFVEYVRHELARELEEEEGPRPGGYLRRHSSLAALAVGDIKAALAKKNAG